jgi:hypothetical protein
MFPDILVAGAAHLNRLWIMNKLPCPACKKTLWWNGTTTSPNKFDTEGKRWYQYAGPRTYCKYCGVRLRNPYASRLLLAAAVFFVLVNPFVVQPLAKEYGPIIFLPLLIVMLVIVAIFWPYYRYEKWDDHKKTNKP